MAAKRKRIKVLVVFGGKSAEHEVSLMSAKNVIDSLDRKKYQIFLAGIDKNGKWKLGGEHVLPPGETGRFLSRISNRGGGNTALVLSGGGKQLMESSNESVVGVDVVFPVLHGPFGEDGTVQGMLKLADVPFVGAGVLGSAVGMDKDVQKRLLRDAGIPVAKFLVFRSNDVEKIDYQKVVKELSLPLFVKPANLGSSIGISKVKNEGQFFRALANAFSYDSKVVIEEFIRGRELECSVLGNDNPIASLLGEVLPKHDFYSYEAKYLDESGASLEIPAKLPAGTVKKVQAMAVEVFKVLCCEGMARADFFLKDNGDLMLNEINTIPGFTNISMYPKLWEASGLPYSKLIDRLIELAVERFKKEKKFKTTHV